MTDTSQNRLNKLRALFKKCYWCGKYTGDVRTYHMSQGYYMFYDTHTRDLCKECVPSFKLVIIPNNSNKRETSNE